MPEVAPLRRRLALLAPMPSELAPLVQQLALRPAEVAGIATHVGALGAADIVAARIGIGTRRARDATLRLLDATRPDHAVVVGIAGGARGVVALGDVIAPERVIDEATGREACPTPLEPQAARGLLLTSDRFDYPPAELAAWIARGVLAFDMETYAVGRACEERGVPWSAFRAISDFAGPLASGGTDPAVLTLVSSDGTPRPAAVVRYVLRHPLRALRLRKLAAGATLAADRAALAAVAACRGALRDPRAAAGY